jgi:[ribosomal protein S5]-alanine N-acetyltransferase
MFRDPATTFIGRCGIHRWRDEVELGYIVEPSFWGQGHGTEMATAVASHAFTALSLSSLVAFTRHGNVASRRAMEKVGFLYEGDFIDEGARHVLYHSMRIPFRWATSPRQAVSGCIADHSRAVGVDAARST